MLINKWLLLVQEAEKIDSFLFTSPTNEKNDVCIYNVSLFQMDIHHKRRVHFIAPKYWRTRFQTYYANIVFNPIELNGNDSLVKYFSGSVFPLTDCRPYVSNTTLFCLQLMCSFFRLFVFFFHSLHSSYCSFISLFIAQRH